MTKLHSMIARALVDTARFVSDSVSLLLILEKSKAFLVNPRRDTLLHFSIYLP